MAVLQIVAIPTGIAVVCALPSTKIHRFHFVPSITGHDTSRLTNFGSADEPLPTKVRARRCEVPHKIARSLHRYAQGKWRESGRHNLEVTLTRYLRPGERNRTCGGQFRNAWPTSNRSCWRALTPDTRNTFLQLGNTFALGGQRFPALRPGDR